MFNSTLMLHIYSNEEAIKKYRCENKIKAVYQKQSWTKKTPEWVTCIILQKKGGSLM